MENRPPLPPDLAEYYSMWEQMEGRTSDSTVPTESPSSEEKPKATKLTGRLAATPRFDVRDSRFRVNFTLAQHLDDGSTVFHQMYSTGPRVEKLREKNLTKGDLVEVTGVWQRHVVGKKKDGELIERRVFYCYGARVR